MITAMEIIRIPRIIRDTAKSYMMRGKSIGFVPTMGALHEGHLSLVKRARHENDIAVVSIFVNPKQFGPTEDFQQYPRDIQGDSEKLRKENIDILFLPDTTSMYHEDFDTFVEVQHSSDKLCGAFRPGHFRGVATVVMKLLNIVRPVRAYFGQKDFQQTFIIRKMVRDLDMDPDVIICPTVREHDGLAMSSRNAYLDMNQRKAATALYQCLKKASESIQAGTRDAHSLTLMMRDMLEAEKEIAKIDYVGIYDPETLDAVLQVDREVLLAVAAYIGTTRLIDNMLIPLNTEGF